MPVRFTEGALVCYQRWGSMVSKLYVITKSNIPKCMHEKINTIKITWKRFAIHQKYFVFYRNSHHRNMFNILFSLRIKSILLLWVEKIHNILQKDIRSQIRSNVNKPIHDMRAVWCTWSIIVWVNLVSTIEDEQWVKSISDICYMVYFRKTISYISSHKRDTFQ